MAARHSAEYCGHLGSAWLWICLVLVASCLPSGPESLTEDMTKGPRASSGASGLTATLAWFDEQDLVAGDGVRGDGFATSVSVSGNTAIVGAPGASVGSSAGQGAAYVFQPSAASWSSSQKLVASDGAAGDAFGASVAISNQIILVGAPSPATKGPGSAYVFVQSGGSWIQQQKLVPTGQRPAGWDGFGQSVAISGTTAVVAAPLGGMAYVFEQSGTQWMQQPELPLGFPGNLGATIAISGDTIFVGTPYTIPGSTYTFLRQGTTWTTGQTLVAGDPTDGDQFGGALAIFGDMAVIDARNAKNNVNQANGAAYVFNLSGTSWTQEQKLPASDGSTNSTFGPSVAASDTAILVATAPGSGQAKAYQFAKSVSGWSQEPTLSFGDSSVLSSASISGSVAFVGDPQGGSQGAGMAHVLGLLPGGGSTCSSGADCGSTFCVSGVCCDGPCGACGTCSTGTCVNRVSGTAGDPGCGPYVCDGSSLMCPRSCGDDGGCAPSYYCSAGQCVAKQPDGSACTADDQCSGGHCGAGDRCSPPKPTGSACAVNAECGTKDCVDGFCCDLACAGQCEACDVPGSEGICLPVMGTPHAPRPACAEEGSTCGSQCDGTETQTCVYSGNPCGTSCLNGLLSENACDGHGACLPISSRSCQNFACADSATCKVLCLSNHDCVAGFTCDPTGRCITGAVCRDYHTSIGSDGTARDCSPYVCDDAGGGMPASGACRTKCATAADCAPPAICDLEGLCVPPSSSKRASGGCSSSASAPPPGGPLGGWVALAILRGRRSRANRISLRSSGQP